MIDKSIDKERLQRYFNENNPGDAMFAEKVFTDDSKELQLKEILGKQFDELNPDKEAIEKNLDHIFYKIYYNITSSNAARNTIKFQSFIKWTYRLAGIICIPLVLFMGLYLYRASLLKDNYWVEIKAPAWTRAQFRLPDGTTGWLNSNSGIKYSGNFTNQRTVSLTGEAYFDVAKNPRKPFVVKTREVNVKVLGTRFNIASYENEANVEVVLEEGRLAFSDKALSRTYTMKPNDLVVYNKEKKKCTIAKVHSGKYTSWKEGKLVFRNDPIDVIARRLERWYNVVVINNVPASEDIRWRATFEDEDLEKVLDLMKRTLPVHFEIEDPGINSNDVYAKKKITIGFKK